MTPLRIAILDDHAVLRAGLRLLIDAEKDMEVVGEAGDGPAGLRMVESVRPDVLLLDLELPGRNGLEMLEDLRKACPEMAVVVLTMFQDAGLLRAAFAAGALGYVTKRAADRDLLSAIRAVAKHQVYVDSESAREEVQRLHAELPWTRQAPGGRRLLSPREEEVASLLALGHTNIEVADRLGVSVKTIESHRSRLYQKLGISTRAQLAQYARAAGIVAVLPRSTPSKP